MSTRCSYHLLSAILSPIASQRQIARAGKRAAKAGSVGLRALWYATVQIVPIHAFDRALCPVASKIHVGWEWMVPDVQAPLCYIGFRPH